MGVNITLSVESLLKRNTSRWQIAYKVIRRTIILFALGATVINHNSKHLETVVFGLFHILNHENLIFDNHIRMQIIFSIDRKSKFDSVVRIRYLSNLRKC